MATVIIWNATVDLRRYPIDLTSNDYSHNDQRETQLLFNEQVRILKEENDWVFVEAVEQPIFSDAKGWHAYPGWVRESEIKKVKITREPNLVVSSPSVLLKPHNIEIRYGTYLVGDVNGRISLADGSESWCDPKDLRALNRPFDRAQLVKDASYFLGAPYLWGGRSIYCQNGIASVDCSGLINLLYRAQGILIPRNAHDQFLKGISSDEPFPGDPAFLSKDGKRISHVILKIDEQHFIEAPETGKCVRLLKWGKDLWEDKGMWHYVDRADPYFFSFKSLIKSTSV